MKQAMNLELLGHIARQRLPLMITAPLEVQALRLLRQAGMLAAFCIRPLESATDHMQILAITPRGRRAIAV